MQPGTKERCSDYWMQKTKNSIRWNYLRILKMNENIEGGRITSNPICPTCNHKLDGYTSTDLVNPSEPVEGDYSICGKCLEFNIFKKDLTLRPITDDDMLSMSCDNIFQLINARKALKFYLLKNDDFVQTSQPVIH